MRFHLWLSLYRQILPPLQRSMRFETALVTASEVLVGLCRSSIGSSSVIQSY